jgi:hypothetical protein
MKSTRHIRKHKDYRILQGSRCKTPRASSSSEQGHMAARVVPRRRSEQLGLRLVDAGGGGDRGKYVGMLTGVKDEERRPESEDGQSLGGWRLGLQAGTVPRCSAGDGGWRRRCGSTRQSS